jgi:hypothetical protein
MIRLAPENSAAVDVALDVGSGAEIKFDTGTESASSVQGGWLRYIG